MIQHRRTLLCLLAGATLVAALTAAPREAFAGLYRQYYSQWTYSNANQYYYRAYYYLPAPTVTVYSYHYVIYYPTRPDYCYYYNPHKQVFWGRASSDPAKNPGYSLLAPEDRKANLTDIPETAFGKLGEMPPIPDSNDGAKLQLAPSDVPKGPAK